MENSVPKDRKALAVISEPPETPTFTFLRLPTELRIQVWKHYCPDLCEVPRLLDFAIGAIRPFGNLGHPCQHILRGLRLVDRTRSLRCVLAVHQQSRGFALAVFPDKLTVGYCADLAKECDIPFHKQRDLVYLYGFTGGTIPPHELDVATMVSRLASDQSKQIPLPLRESAGFCCVYTRTNPSSTRMSTRSCTCMISVPRLSTWRTDSPDPSRFHTRYRR